METRSLGRTPSSSRPPAMLVVTCQRWRQEICCAGVLSEVHRGDGLVIVAGVEDRGDAACRGFCVPVLRYVGVRVCRLLAS